MAQTEIGYNPFAAAMAPRTFRASLAKVAVIQSKFPTQSGGVKFQLYLVLVRWPTENNPKPATFSRYIGDQRSIRALGAGLRRLIGKEPVPEDIDAMCPLHLEWEERPQADWRDKDGLYHPSKDQLVPTTKVTEIVPEDVEVACREARITREGMEVSDDSASQDGSFDEELRERFIEAVVGKNIDDVASIADEFAGYGPQIVSYIVSNQALNQMLVEGVLTVTEEGVIGRV